MYICHLLQPLQALVPGNMDNEERTFYVLSGTQLQRWSVYDGCTEKVKYSNRCILGKNYSVNSASMVYLAFACYYIVVAFSCHGGLVVKMLVFKHKLSHL